MKNIESVSKVEDMYVSLEWKEQKKLFNEYRVTKDPVIREKLILANLRLVPYVAREYYAYSGYSQEDLESAGYEELVRLIDKFDLSRGAKFSTFAVKSLLGAMQNEVRNSTNIPGNRYDGIKSAIKTVESIQNKEKS